jgi:hypothetical protein
MGDLSRPEETVIIKQARLPRQQAELGPAGCGGSAGIS